MISLIPLISMVISHNQLICLKPNLAFPLDASAVVKVWPALTPKASFTQAIISWNVGHAGNSHITVEAKAHGDRFDTKWFVMAEWSLNVDQQDRTSLSGQGEENGDVNTDTLSLTKPAKSLDIRVTLTNPTSANGEAPLLKLLTVSFSQGEAVTDAPIKSAAWGKSVDVPQRAQGNYPNGSVLCSATSTSMLLSHWSNVLARPELDRDVPEVEAGVWDKAYKGAGNWPFNAAYFGSMDGLRGYVARFNAISDLEKWILSGIPVATSVSFDMLRGKPLSPTEQGHLVVLVGFTPDGDPIINDPAFKDGVRKTYKRTDFARAWAYSHHTVYVFTAENSVVPPNTGGLWVGK